MTSIKMEFTLVGCLLQLVKIISKSDNIKELNFLDPVHVSSAVIASGQTFYQIGDKEFVPADLVSLDLQPEWILPYWNLSIINPTQKSIFTYNKPDKQSGKKNRYAKKTL